MKVEWILALLELAGIFLALIKAVIMIGKTLQKIEDHDRRIDRIEQHLDPQATFLVKAKS